MGAACGARPGVRGQRRTAASRGGAATLGTVRAHRALGRIVRRSLLPALIMLLAAGLWIAALAGPAGAEGRSALVIGNSAYSFGKLANPRNDAETMARTLRGVGFDVMLLLDADRETMRKAVVAFGRKLRGSDAVGVFYFAGHGVQVAAQNYLLPVDADVTAESEVALQAINLSELLATMRSNSSRVAIAILDACRNNPFTGATRAIQAGLAQTSAPAGTLIAFATAPGEVAFDGDTGNSPYTNALARQIPVPGISVEDVFKRAREQVLKATDGRQTPWEHSSLIGTFQFKPRASEPEGGTTGADPDTALRVKELHDWAAIKDSTDIEAFKRHIAAYPGGAFEELATYKISLLAKRPTGWSAILTSAPSAPRERTEAERYYEQAVEIEGGAGPGGLSRERAERVVALYRQAADLGLVPAMYALGRALERGDGTKKDEAAAAKWLAKAVAANFAPAMSALGTLHEYGRGTSKDLLEALRLYKLSADRNDAHGMACFAYLLAEGKGVARNEAEARRWYKRSAELGSTRSMFNLALMLMRRQGGPQDIPAALAWLNQAASKGHTASLRELAAMYDDGRHVARNPKLAAQYLLDAARSHPGHPVVRARGDVWTVATRLELQRRLQADGHYTGRLTGALDGTTLEALLAYGTSGAADSGKASASVATGQTRSPPFASGVLRSRLGVASLP